MSTSEKELSNELTATNHQSNQEARFVMALLEVSNSASDAIKVTTTLEVEKRFWPSIRVADVAERSKI